MRRAAALALVCASFVASAQEGGFLRTRVPGKELCLHWSARRYVYNYHSSGSTQTPGTAEFVAMESAFDSWRALAKDCSDFVFESGPMVGTAVVGYDRDSTDNTNVIVFRERHCRAVVPENDPCWADGRTACGNKYQCWDNGDRVIALTTSTFSTVTGIVFDSDIEFNAAPDELGERFLFTTISGPPCEPEAQSALCSATDVQNTLTHEIGHVIGLDHVEVSGSTMEPTAPIGETQKRVLDEGTRAGFCRIYPKAQPTPPCEDVDVYVEAVNQGTRGLKRVGCAAAGGGASFGLGGGALVLLMGRWRRGRRGR